MLTSYLLSRTLVPAMASYLLPDKHQEVHGTGIWSKFLARLRSRLRAPPQTLCVWRYRLHRTSRPFADVCRADDRRDAPAAVCHGRGFLSDGRRRTHEISRARAERNADRADSSYRRRYRALDQADNSRRRAAADQRRHRSAAAVCDRVFPERQHRSAGRRNSDPAQAQASSDRRLSATHPRNDEHEVPERRRLLHGRRHREPGAELRAARGDRRSDQRQRSPLRLPDRHRASQRRWR